MTPILIPHRTTITTKHGTVMKLLWVVLQQGQSLVYKVPAVSLELKARLDGLLERFHHIGPVRRRHEKEWKIVLLRELETFFCDLQCVERRG